MASPHRDVTDLFAGAIPGEGHDNGPEDVISDDSGPLLLPDPLGLLERLSRGRVRDPVRALATRFIKYALS